MVNQLESRMNSTIDNVMNVIADVVHTVLNVWDIIDIPNIIRYIFEDLNTNTVDIAQAITGTSNNIR